MMIIRKPRGLKQLVMTLRQTRSASVPLPSPRIRPLSIIELTQEHELSNKMPCTIDPPAPIC